MKEQTGMLKSEIETLKEDDKKLREDIRDKEILIKRLTETLNEEMAKQNLANRNQTNAKISILSKYAIRHEKQICSTS